MATKKTKSDLLLPGLIAERKKMLEDRMRQVTLSTDRITNSAMPSGYTCPELIAPAIRPGADDALEIPSRYGDRLHYRNGRVVFISKQETQ